MIYIINQSTAKLSGASTATTRRIALLYRYESARVTTLMVIMCGAANSINGDVHSVMAHDLIRLALARELFD